MAWVWSGMVALSVVCGLFKGTIGAVGSAALEGAGAAVELCLGMAGVMCLWNGVMSVMKACGLLDGLCRLFRPLLGRLLPRASQDPDTLAALSGNVSANLLGLGNAATPLGVKAAQRMAAGTGGRATDELCRLVVLNTASIQLLPTTVAGVRAALGAESAFDILPAVWTASALSVAAGLLAGLVTGLLHTACGIPAILAGILTQLGLWSVNLAVMGMKANVAINVTDQANLDRLLVSLRFVQDVAKGNRPFYRHPILVVGVFSLAIISVLYWFFGTELGASLRATGANPNMARAQGINTDTGKVLGLMLSNGLVALSGALLSQYQSFADASMGKGAIVIGLAAVIIGQVVFGRIFRNFALKMLAVSLGAVIYYTVIQAVVSLSNINTNYLKLISAIIVAVFLTIPYWKGKYFHAKVKTGGASHA